MNENQEAAWQRLIQGLRGGDPQCEQEFWNQYGPALLQRAEGKLNPRLRRRISPEDVVQSACRTFLRRAKLGQFTLEDSESLWRLLCAITLTKVREQTRFHLRQKRGLDQEIHAACAPGAQEQTSPDANLAANGPTPAEAVEFADFFAQLLSSLDEEERQIVELALENHTQLEIADRLGMSERTLRRAFKRLKTRLARLLDKDGN